MDRAQFYKEVYSIIKEIPYGNVSTYGKIAQLIGKPQCSRMVGQALSHAPKEQHLPCHRVVNSQGRLVPGWQKQKELLEKEGITFKPNGCVNMSKHLWDTTGSLTLTTGQPHQNFYSNRQFQLQVQVESVPLYYEYSPTLL